MHRLLFAVAALAGSATLAAAQDTPAPAASATPSPAPASTGDIVVTGRSLTETAAALAACLARNCPPDQDIAATLAHAENQFLNGDYRDARGTMLSSIRRNRDETRGFPVEVSGLYRANARVAAHLGEGRAYQLSVLEMRDALTDGLNDTDPRVLSAEIEVADSRARLGYPDEARLGYQQVARTAERLSLPRVAAFARLRHAMLDHPGRVATPAERNSRMAREARATLASLIDQGGTIGTDVAFMAEVMLARFERDMGDSSRTTAIMGRLAARSGSRPLLISGEPVQLTFNGDAVAASGAGDSGINVAGIGTGNGASGGNSVLGRSQTVSVESRWMDVGFWVNADGRVTDFEVLRHDGDLNWSRDVERSINSRRYSPIRADADGTPAAGFYMIERYTMTANFRNDCTGSRLRCRAQGLIVERLDLTPENIATVPPRRPS